MDENKKRRLKEVLYHIPPCCGLCAHGAFRPGQYFGVCGKYTYEHEKHTGPPRQLSISRYGVCMTPELDLQRVQTLEGYAAFVDGDGTVLAPLGR